MAFLRELLADTVRALVSFGPELREVVWLTLFVAGTATLIGVLVGIPLGSWLALGESRIRRIWRLAVNVGMGMPPVLAGLLILILVWDDGPLGQARLLFTPAAMIIAQAFLAIPIAAGVTAAAIRGLAPAAREQLDALGLGRAATARVALAEVWPGVVAAVAAAFGRVVSEVGAVLVVGGNIAGETRVLTTATVQEARQADFATALAFGAVLMVIALVINVFLARVESRRW